METLLHQRQGEQPFHLERLRLLELVIRQWDSALLPQQVLQVGEVGEKQTA